jgi:hypothetical protein
MYMLRFWPQARKGDPEGRIAAGEGVRVGDDVGVREGVGCNTVAVGVGTTVGGPDAAVGDAVGYTGVEVGIGVLTGVPVCTGVQETINTEKSKIARNCLLI